MIRDRVDQHLVAQRRRTAIARHQRDGGGEIAARAVSRDRDARAVDADFAAVFGNPTRCGVAILGGGGVGVLGRQPVVDRHHDGVRAVCQRAAEVVVGLEVADHPAAAVEEDHGRRRRWRAVGAIDAHRDGAGRAGNRPVLDLRDGLGRDRQLHRLERLACLVGRELAHLHAALCGELVEHESGLGVERHGASASGKSRTTLRCVGCASQRPMHETRLRLQT